MQNAAETLGECQHPIADAHTDVGSIWLSVADGELSFFYLDVGAKGAKPFLFLFPESRMKGNCHYHDEAREARHDGDG